ncbi:MULTISPECIES: hypothetical protein [unclassified Methylophaga]|jgi:hypothetical protein|uniref:hypothetical protein n=1 Tax=unclassified Methylophaga TaxID=2629249 RepID=UPI00259CFB36|nr:MULTISPECIES: hypothetical protein [unclassified Methylophaga]|tara:strand:+ start:3450 stop:3704 length:255 start_codon:yes stop_codon:yes gene_type:complete
MISTEIKEARSIHDVVQLIDSGGTHHDSPEEVAGTYAYLAVINSDHINKEHAKSQLDDLIEAGAKFDYDLALEHAESHLIEAQH